MAIPDFQALLLPLLRLAATGERTIKACVASLAAEFGVTPAELEEMLPSRRAKRFYNRVAWAKTHLQAAGLVEAVKHGVFRATGRGREVLRQPPAALDIPFLLRFPEYAVFRGGKKGDPPPPPPPPSGKGGGAEAGTPEERLDAALDELTAAVRADLLARVRAADPPFFERVIVDLLVAMGYGGSRTDAGQTLGGSGDGGVDGVIKEDTLGLDVVYLQAKRYAPDHAVSEEQVRGFAGSLLGKGATKGVFVTTSYFTDPARRFAAGLRQQKVVLLDGDELGDLLLRHRVGVRAERTLEVKRIDLDYFEGADADPS